MNELKSGLFEFLQIDENMSVADLSVGQLVEIVNFIGFPPVCANFVSFPMGQQYPPNHVLVVNNLRFVLGYDGGGRISEWDGYPGEHFLEMVGGIGSVIIDSPVKATRIDLEVIQAGPDPIEIEYFNNYSGIPLGVVKTTQKDVIEHIQIAGADLTYIKMSKPELLIRRICFQA
jgi:hypothetical protein